MSMPPLHRGDLWSVLRGLLGHRGNEHNVRDSITGAAANLKQHIQNAADDFEKD